MLSPRTSVRARYTRNVLNGLVIQLSRVTPQIEVGLFSPFTFPLDIFSFFLKTFFAFSKKNFIRAFFRQKNTRSQLRTGV